MIRLENPDDKTRTMPTKTGAKTRHVLVKKNLNFAEVKIRTAI
jgi:hypothetical protein